MEAAPPLSAPIVSLLIPGLPAGAAVLMAFTAAAGAQEPFAAGRAGVAWRPLVPAAAGVDPAIVLLLLLSVCLSLSCPVPALRLMAPGWQ